MDVYHAGIDETPKKKKKKYFRWLWAVWLVDALADSDDWLQLLLLKSIEPDVNMNSEFCVRYPNYNLAFLRIIRTISTRVGLSNHMFTSSHI